jgi:hypothetical protein
MNTETAPLRRIAFSRSPRTLCVLCSVVMLATLGGRHQSPAGGLFAEEHEQGPGSPGGTVPWREAAADYARILSQVKWTPVAETMPNRRGGHFEKGKEYTGVPYSSVRSVGRYIGFDVSVRTFLAAVDNPHSVLYTENLRGKVPNAACYYGTVCSAYTSYALQCGFPFVSRHHGPGDRDGVTEVTSPTAQSVLVGDVIFTPPRPGSHVEIVTGISRDERGNVTHVLVEESAPPTTRTTNRTAARFNAHLSTADRTLYRIHGLDAWRSDNTADAFQFPNYQADAETPAINRTLLLDLGDWVPYHKEQIVKFNVMDRDQLGVQQLIIQREGKTVETIPLAGTGIIERSFAECGDYAAFVVRKDGSRSPACEFAVCDLSLNVLHDSLLLDREWELEFASNNMNVIAIHLWNESNSYGRYTVFVSDEDRQRGGVTMAGNLLQKPGQLQVWLIGEHRYGRLKARQDILVDE